MAPQQQRPRNRRLAFVAAGIVTSVALASGPVYAVGAGVVRVGDPPAPTPTAVTPPATSSTTGGVRTTAPVAPAASAPPSASAPARTRLVPTAAGPGRPAAPGSTPTPSGKQAAAAPPAFGAYLDYGAGGIARIGQLSKWLGVPNCGSGTRICPATAGATSRAIPASWTPGRTGAARGATGCSSSTSR